MRNGKPVRHIISSFIWNDLKDHYSIVSDNSTWLNCNGLTFNFPLDRWWGPPFVDRYNISTTSHIHIETKTNTFLVNKSWSLPFNIQLAFHDLENLLDYCCMSMEDKNNTKVWNHSTSGNPFVKLACEFCKGSSNHVSWQKLLWDSCISPSKTMMFWRLNHNSISIDELISSRDFSFSSQCNLCY